jgi:transcriptional regulator with XRE-family HTH domain
MRRVFSPTRLREARTKKNLSRQELAQRYGQSVYNVRDLENGRTGLSVAALVSLADALEIQIDELFEDARSA